MLQPWEFVGIAEYWDELAEFSQSLNWEERLRQARGANSSVHSATPRIYIVSIEYNYSLRPSRQNR